MEQSGISPPRESQLLGFRQDLKVGAYVSLSEQSGDKANTARQGREIFPSKKILLTESCWADTNEVSGRPKKANCSL